MPLRLDLAVINAITTEKIKWSTIYPIGSIYLSTSSTNPGTFFKGTTWERYANGRVLVGVNESDADFTAGKTGGAKTVTLTTSQIPSHTHLIGNFNPNNFGTTQHLTWPVIMTEANDDTHFSWNVKSAPTGGGQSHNNLQPYISVYIWRRTA